MPPQALLFRRSSLALASCVISPFVTAGELIPVPGRKDHVFDPIQRKLYVTTQAGTVERYDAEAGALLAPWSIGGTLGGIDITPDSATLVVADRTYSTVTDLGTVRRIDVASGAVTTLQFPVRGGIPGYCETGAWDVVTLSNGKALFTTDFDGVAQAPVHELDLATNVIVNRESDAFLGPDRHTSERTWLFRDTTHSEVIGLQINSDGALFTYSTATDEFANGMEMRSYPGEPFQEVFHLNGNAAVSPNGEWFAVEKEPTNEIWIFDSSFSSIRRKLFQIDGGVLFDPERDFLFAIDTIHDEIVVYETGTWLEVDRIAAGWNLEPTSQFSHGTLSYDAATASLYLSVSGGILRIDSVPEPGTSGLLGVALVLVSMLARRADV